MPPVSSLIFVVILAVWAVYLVQHWVRRRDHLATARSVDRFSEAMRVLERRRALPRPDVSEHAPASASVPLLRPARPEVVVKRGAPARPVTATAVAPTAAYHRGRRAAQLRAAGLLASSLVMVILVGLVGFQLIHWAWAFVGIALLAATVAGLRRSVARSRRARPASRPHSRDLRRPAEARPELAAQATAVAVPRTARRAVDLEARRPASVPTVALYDIDEVEARLTQPAPDEVVAHPAAELMAVQAPVVEPAPAAPGSWDPVPVPPPTYTLKAKAYRAPAELPADGAEMALEEEFEELPQVHRVG
ncbi:hypothetical protein [Ornithinimicrobium pratense]|uniref:Uncharacterized protein n=1 Tax=Ornithinimicrobium pratense TaxID=2593973 RepID=A0A5J6V1M6_9MICO|nr:hypothetical protein [Ornithinimicrobium pratense]QFG67710.1 hypothetical protein FY030_02300 [Ornithinimicrobium pratense]